MVMPFIDPGFLPLSSGPASSPCYFGTLVLFKFRLQTFFFLSRNLRLARLYVFQNYPYTLFPGKELLEVKKEHT